MINNDSFNNGQSIEEGLIVDEEGGGPFYTGGVLPPIGLDLPTRTLYVQTTAEGVILWRHPTTDPQDWAPITSAIFAASPPPYILNHNGTLSADQLVGYSNLSNNPVVVGFESRLSRVTAVAGNDVADFALDFFFGLGDGGDGNGFHRYEVINNTPNYSAITTSPTFQSGDRCSIYYRDLGQNANDLNIGLFFEAAVIT